MEPLRFSSRAGHSLTAASSFEQSRLTGLLSLSLPITQQPHRPDVRPGTRGED